MSQFEKHEPLFLKALKIRLFEKKLLDLAGSKKLSGTVHTCIGQELIPVTVSQNLKPDDYIFSNHRCHGHYLAAFDDYKGLALEILSHSDGVNQGLGGSQHIHRERFYSSGIQGSMLGVALGTAYSQKEEAKKGIVVCYVGDGTFGEGIVYEVLNIASLWNLPLIIVVEDNGYAQSTPQSQYLSGSIQKRCVSFGIMYTKTNSFDLEEMSLKVNDSVDFVRNSQKPCLVHVETYRLSPHSKGDDHRSQKELDSFRKKDLLSQYEKEVSPIMTSELQKQIDSCFETKSSGKSVGLVVDSSQESNVEKMPVSFEKGTRKELNLSLHKVMEKFSSAVIWGEDVEDPYGGAFKATQGLSTKFPLRVRNTPISEQAIVSMGIGRALTGKPTIVEIMFSDFIGLSYDSIFNTASKIISMFGTKKKLPLIIRAANGPNSGYGATHSQDASSVFYGTPFVQIYSTSKFTDYSRFYPELVAKTETTALVFENKNAFSQMKGDLSKKLEPHYQVVSLGNILQRHYHLGPVKEESDLTVIISPVLLEEMESALTMLLQDEVLADVFIPEHLNSFPWADLEKSLKKTKRLLILESNEVKGSWSTYVWYKLSLKITFKGEVAGTPASSIPSGLENEKNFFPNAEMIAKKMRELYELR